MLSITLHHTSYIILMCVILIEMNALCYLIYTCNVTFIHFSGIFH